MAAVAKETGGTIITATTSPFVPKNKAGRSITMQEVSSSAAEAGEDVSTPISLKLQGRATATNSKVQHTARKIAMNAKTQLQSSEMKSSVETPHLVQENQAIKRRKLEGGKTGQILLIKPQVLPHKSKLGLTTGSTNISSSTNGMHKDNRKVDASHDQMTPKPTLIKTMENPWKPHLTEPKTPVFQTSIRSRPPKKSSVELELEELQKIPKFKARPLNKKIFESKGDIGVFCNAKKQVTEPKEFHFATHERIPPPAVAAFLDFDKLYLKSECARKKKPISRNTIPKPFHFHTEEREAEKEKKLVTELQHKQLDEEEISRIPKVSQNPESKQCTKAEPFQLVSLVRHEEEMKQLTVKREEDHMRDLKAQPILKEDPIPIKDKVRKPLTQVHAFNLHAENRAVARAQFDEKVTKKEMVYKRFRDESEATRMANDEKAMKQLRRTAVPYVRPAPKFDHLFFSQKSAKGTKNPKSPNLHVAQMKESQRQKIFSDTVISSPAARLR